MPELPEVETVLRGLKPHVAGRHLTGARVRNPNLRWPVPSNLDGEIEACLVRDMSRRGKYLLLHLDCKDQQKNLIIHLGMSGSLRLCPEDEPPAIHDHVDILLEGGQCLRLRDPRRFGAVLLTPRPGNHPLLDHLGLEPLEPEFNGDWLHALCRGRKTAIKQLVMDGRKLVGVGNIYANEALFHGGIDPRLPAGRLSRPRCERLANAIKETLDRAIAAGGSSLRDFVNGHGQPGYFQQTYYVYGRTGDPCRVCSTPIRHQVQGTRSTFYCPRCQKR